MDFSEQIRAGMAWLDENALGWDVKINLEKLNMRDAHRCVLGQLFGSFYNNVPQNSYATAAVLGFWVGDESDDYGTLTEQWREAIQARRDTYSGVAAAVAD